MTIVNKNSTSHSGLLVTESGDDIDIDVELIGGRTLRMSASGDELGAWPIDECHIEPDPERNGTFRIVVDGDDAVFTPVDPVGFRSLIEYVMGATSNGDEGPQEMRSDTLGAALESRGASATPGTSAVAADDPVAFLFGSSPPPPPPPPTPPDVNVGPTSRDADEVPQPDLPLSETDPDSDEVSGDDLDPVDLESVEFDLDELEDVEVTIEAVSAHSSPATDADSEVETESEMESPGTDDPIVPTDLPPPVVSPTLADRLEQAERLEAEDLGEITDSMDVDALEEVTTERSRFGASALDRLSEAISSVTSSSSSSSTSTSTSADEDEVYDLEPNNVADEVLTTQRSLRDHRVKEAKRSQRLKFALIAAGGIGLIAVIALLAPGAIEFIQNYEGDAAPPPTLAVTETTVVITTTTVPEETTVPDSSTSTTLFAGAEQSVFAIPAPEFVARWDAAAAIVDEVLQFESNPIIGPFEEQFTPYLSFGGEIQPDGRLSGFSLVVDPSGPSEYDRIGIQALGVAIATVDPDRSPQGRAALLGELGLNVREPRLGGIDGSVQSDRVQYTLVYDAETTLLTLTVTPAG